jgi:hypothetical protein
VSDKQLKYPRWRREFQEAVLECDRNTLLEKIQKFEAAVFVRLEELASSSDDHGEREAIADAASTIAVVADRSRVSKATLLQHLLH